MAAGLSYYFLVELFPTLIVAAAVQFQHFANLSKTYGTLGAGIALLVWLDWSGFAILLGAEINSEAIQSYPPRQARAAGLLRARLLSKEPPTDADEIAAEPEGFSPSTLK